MLEVDSRAGVDASKTQLWSSATSPPGTFLHVYLHAYISSYLHGYLRCYIHTLIISDSSTFPHVYISTFMHVYISAFLHFYIFTSPQAGLHFYIYTSTSPTMHAASSNSDDGGLTSHQPEGLTCPSWGSSCMSYATFSDYIHTLSAIGVWWNPAERFTSTYI